MPPAAVTVSAESLAAPPLRVVPEMRAPSHPAGVVAYDPDTVRPCTKGSPETEAARAAVDSFAERVDALPLTPVPKAFADELHELLGTQCFQLADHALRPSFGSGLAAKQWWNDGGYTWLMSLVDLEEARTIVVPPSARRVLASDAGLDDRTRPIAPLLCPTDAQACGRETIGWTRRVEGAFLRRASGTRYGDDACVETAKKAAPELRYDALVDCVQDHAQTRTALPLGRFRAPKDGWLVATGGGASRCSVLRTYDLATGAAYVATACPGKAATVKVGRVPVASLREAAWMLVLAPVVERNVRVDASSFDVPPEIAIEKPSRYGRGRGISIGCGGVHSSRPRHWSWMRGTTTLTGQTSGVLRPSSGTHAEDHASELLAVAEDGFEEGCAPAPPPAKVTWTAPGLAPNDETSASFEDPAVVALATAIQRERPRACPRLP